MKIKSLLTRPASLEMVISGFPNIYPDSGQTNRQLSGIPLFRPRALPFRMCVSGSAALESMRTPSDWYAHSVFAPVALWRLFFIDNVCEIPGVLVQLDL
jgi:hypothetical protein